MNQFVYDKIKMVDHKLAERYELLPQRVSDALERGLLDSITACDALGLMPQREALREIIEDGLRGQYHFKDNLKDRSNRRKS
jgi:hypothetical protein